MKIHKRILQGIVFCIGAAIMAYGIFGISKRFNKDSVARQSVAEHKRALNDPHSHSHEKKRAASQLAKDGEVEAFVSAREWIRGSDETLKKTAIEVLFVSDDPLDFETALAVLDEYPLDEREILLDRLASSNKGRDRLLLLLKDGNGYRPIEVFLIQKALFRKNGGNKSADQWKTFFEEQAQSKDTVISQKSLLLLIQLNHNKDVYLSTLGRMLYEGRVLEELAPEAILVVARQSPLSLDPIYRSLASNVYDQYFESLLFSLRLACPKDSKVFFQQFLENDRVTTGKKVLAVKSFVALNYESHIGIARDWMKTLKNTKTKYELENSFKKLESEQPQCP